MGHPSENFVGPNNRPFIFFLGISHEDSVDTLCYLAERFPSVQFHPSIVVGCGHMIVLVGDE